MEELHAEKLKICFAASSGGHFDQMMLLRPLMDRYDSFIVTEKTEFDGNIGGKRVYYVPQLNRKEIFFPIKLIADSVIEAYIILHEKPDAVISTGVLAVIPLCLLAKLFGKKLIFIESFSNVHVPTKTGKFMYKYADRFYVQWEPLMEQFPDAVYAGWLY